MKKLLKVLLTALLAVTVAVLCVWQGEIRTLMGISKVSESDPYLYVADYKAPYDLDKVLEAGIDANTKLVEFVIARLSRGLYKPDLSGKQTGNGFACTSFQAKNADGGYLFGRNYDFFKNPTLVLRSRPKGGYASISTCDLSHLGYNLEKLPDGLAAKALCLAAVYAPMDGMNEKGLCISIMALPKQAAWQDSLRWRHLAYKVAYESISGSSLICFLQTCFSPPRINGALMINIREITNNAPLLTECNPHAT